MKTVNTFKCSLACMGMAHISPHRLETPGLALAHIHIWAVSMLA